MIKDIKYKGFSETPSDYECPDGDLAAVSGLVPEDEALHPVQDPIVQFTLPNSKYSVAFVHKNTGYKHYIIKETGISYPFYQFYWVDEPERGKEFSEDDFRYYGGNFLIELNKEIEIYDLNAVGNTLMILTSEGIYYFLWQADDNNYSKLGNHLPEISLSFGLQGEIIGDKKKYDVGSVWGDSALDEAWRKEGLPTDDVRTYHELAFQTDEMKNAISDHVLPKANLFIANESVKNGKFIFPFLVRFAYRLYDQSIVMHSVPVLMVPSTKDTSFTFFGDLGNNPLDNQYFIGVFPSAFACDLDYQARIPENLSLWSEIIDSVDVFISAPIYTYNQAGKVSGLKNQDRGWHTISRVLNLEGFEGVTADVANTTDYSKWPPYIYTDEWGVGEWMLPYKSEEEIKDNIQNCHDFYLLKSIPIDELKTERTVIKVPEDYLGTLVNRERMTDDYYSHDQLIAKYSFNYNSRLHLANMSRMLVNSFAPRKAACLNEKGWQRGDEEWTYWGSADYDIYVYIKQDGKTMVVKDKGAQSLKSMSYDFPFLYYFYPDPNAFKAVIKRTYHNEVIKYYELPLKRHDFLNGAVYFEGWDKVPEETEAPTETEDNIVNLPNKMYTSEVGNPFLFMAAGVNTIGLGDIIGIRPAVEAMSTSQYGQYTFYVFSKDGVWALQVSSTGYLEKPQMVVPDVVLGNGESITQIDAAVLFASARGVMLVSGSKCICISDILNSDKPFLPFADEADNDLLRGLRNVVGEEAVSLQEAKIPFRTFVEKCQMLYDYPHQRVIVWNPEQPYAYVYSLKSKEWGMIPSQIVSTVNDYPAASAMISLETEDGNTHRLVDYASDHDLEEETVVKGMLITRPIKLDMPDVLKTIDTIIQRGQFRRGHVKSILYGSRDLYNWQPIWSSVDHYMRGFRGTPYKYFRIALTYELQRDESITGCTIQFTPRLTNQLR